MRDKRAVEIGARIQQIRKDFPSSDEVLGIFRRFWLTHFPFYCFPARNRLKFQ